jgi:hypothetical protein
VSRRTRRHRWYHGRWRLSVGRGIRSELKAQAGDLPGQIQIEHPRTHPSRAVASTHRKDTAHPGSRRHHRRDCRDRTPGDPGAGAPGNYRDPVLPGHPHHTGNLIRGLGKDNRYRLPHRLRSIPAVKAKMKRMTVNPTGTHHNPKIGEKTAAHCHPARLPGNERRPPAANIIRR